MKIAFLVPSLRPAGPVRVVYDLATGLDALGASCSIFYFDSKEQTADWPLQTTRLSFAASRSPGRVRRGPFARYSS